MMDPRVDMLGRSGPQLVRLPSGGQGQQTTPPVPATWFWALLYRFYPWNPADEINPRYAYYWEEAYIDTDGQAQPKNEGRKPGLIATVNQHADGSGGVTGLADLGSPRDGASLPWDDAATTTVDITSVAITNPGATSWHLKVGTTAGGTEIGDFTAISLSTLTVSVPGVPNDGTDFYVQFLTNGLTGPPYYTYRMSLTKAGLAMWRTDINTTQTEQLEGPAGGYQPATDPAETLDPLLVRMWGTDIEGTTVYIFDCETVEYFGQIVESAYQGARYRVELQRVNVTNSAYTAPLEFAPRTSPKNITITATNLGEAHKTDRHSLEDGAYVRVRMARGQPYPHVVRYWFDSSAAYGFTGTFSVVSEVCYENGCVSGTVRVELVYENGLLQSVTPWPITECPTPE